MIPPNAPARTTLRNASTYAPREGSPAGTSESPDSPDSPAPLLAGTSSIAPPLSQAPARNYSVALASSGYCSGGRQSRRLRGRRSAKPPSPRRRIVRRSTAEQPCACHTDGMAETVREWLVAGALVESDGRLLFVRNQRRGGEEERGTPRGGLDA